jgi:Protein of unknown function (DUF1186)
MSRSQELAALFDGPMKRYLRNELEEALTLRKEITPLLIGILEEIASEPQAYAASERNGHTYAVAILAHLREHDAHLPIIRAFRIPNRERDAIWGDMVTMTLPALLCRTTRGNYSAIVELARDRNVYEYVRTSALEAVTLGVGSGDLSREQALGLLRSLFDETLAEPGSYFWGGLVNELLDLYPGEMISDIRRLYEKGLVFPGHVSIEEVEEVAALGHKAAMANLDELLTSRLPEDVHGYISWFGCFEREERTAQRSVSLSSRRPPKDKEKARRKRQQAKASKRKNRT